MKRFLAVLLACILMTGSAFAASEYSVAGKLVKQLWAGSGFTGTITAEMTAKEGTDAASTKKPIVMNVSYIYVRPSETENEGSHYADLTLMDGETEVTAAHFLLEDNKLNFCSDLLGTDWFLAEGGKLFSTEEQTSAADALNVAGAQSLLPFALQGALLLSSTDLDEALSAYLVQVDVWIEGFRQTAEIGRLQDGTITMRTDYSISADELRTEAKTLVRKLLSDSVLLNSLQEALGEENSQLLLNPNLSAWYAQAIDALPIEGELTLSRVQSAEGKTLELHISLPMYDAKGGSFTLKYDREQADDAGQTLQTFSLEGENSGVLFTCTQKPGENGEKLYTGTVTLQTAATETAEAVNLCENYEMSLLEVTGKASDNRDEYTLDLQLKLTAQNQENAALPDTEAALHAVFASKELKAAATDVNATLTLGGEGWNNTLTLTASGKSCKKWEPEAISGKIRSLSEMTTEEITSVLLNAAPNFLSLVNEWLYIPAAETPVEESTVTAE